MRALILVDLQNDFCPGGALEVADGDAVIPIANRLMDKFDVVVATQDWHPANHSSFAANHPWRKPYQIIEMNGLKQTLWPIHCVQNSMGALIHKGLESRKIHQVIQKGTDVSIDSYSGFFDNGHLKMTDLHDYLQAQKVTKVYVMGLATDYCVKHTALDALELGYEVALIEDACRGVDLNAGDVEKALQEMRLSGVKMTNSKRLKSITAC